MADGRSGSVLAQLVEELNARRIRVVDLTTTLGPETPVIDLPPIFAPSPGLTLTEISRYDARGPAWYWNVLTLGEHTGTHFDAPIHWVTGKDLPENATDTIAPGKFIGPACVIDVTADVKANKTSCSPLSVSSHGRRRMDISPQAPGCCCALAGAPARRAKGSSTYGTTAPTHLGSREPAPNSWRTNAMSWASA